MPSKNKPFSIECIRCDDSLTPIVTLLNPGPFLIQLVWSSDGDGDGSGGWRPKRPQAELWGGELAREAYRWYSLVTLIKLWKNTENKLNGLISFKVLPLQGSGSGSSDQSTGNVMAMRILLITYVLSNDLARIHKKVSANFRVHLPGG